MSDVFVFEQRHEGKGQHQRIAGENQPHALPVSDPLDGKVFDDFAAHHPAENTAEAVGHHQEHPLSAGADFRAHLFLNEHRTGDVKEVEGAAVDDHRQHQQYSAERRRVVDWPPESPANQYHLNK